MRARDAYIAQREGKPSAYSDTLRSLPKDVKGIEGKIATLRIFPGKALGELLIDEAIITRHGLRMVDGPWDRSFMIGVKNSQKKNSGDPDFLRFSQREQPELSLLKPHTIGSSIIYTGPGIDSLEVHSTQLDPQSPSAKVNGTGQVEVAGDVMSAYIENGSLTEGIRKFLMQFRSKVDDIHVLLPDIFHRRTVEDQHRCEQDADTLFTDGGQVLLGSATSLDYLNERIRNRRGNDARQISMEAFRPNIEVSDWPANLEDILQKTRIEGVRGNQHESMEMLFGNLSIRCSVTMVDPQTGKRHTDGEPLGTANLDRPKRLNGSKIPTFAVNTVFPRAEWGKRICVGDRIVAVTEKSV